MSSTGQIKIYFDPTSGSGLSAPLGTMAVRDNAGTLVTYVKIGSADTAWQIWNPGAGDWLSRHLIRGARLCGFPVNSYDYWTDKLNSTFPWILVQGAAPTLLSATSSGGFTVGSACVIDAGERGTARYSRMASLNNKLYIAARWRVTNTIPLDATSIARIGVTDDGIGGLLTFGVNGFVLTPNYDKWAILGSGTAYPTVYSSVVADNNWHDMELACDQTTAKLYLDNSETAIATSTKNASDTAMKTPTLYTSGTAGFECTHVLVMFPVP